MDQLNVVNILRRHFPQNFEVFTWDEVYDLFRGENCFICREGTDVSCLSVYEKSTVYLISDVAQDCLNVWMKDSNSTEIWVFAFVLFEGLRQRVILHLVKGESSGGTLSVFAIVDMDPSIVHDYACALIDRSHSTISFYLNDGNDLQEPINPLSDDEVLCFHLSEEGRTINEIAEVCCWSVSKTKKLRQSLLDKFHANNFAQVIRISEIFNIKRNLSCIHAV